VREEYAEEVPKRKKTTRELKDLGSVRVTMNGEHDQNKVAGKMSEC